MGMSAAVALKQSTTLKSDFCGTAVVSKSAPAATATNVAFAVRAARYDEELVNTANTIASKGRAMDESNATCGKRLASIDLVRGDVVPVHHRRPDHGRLLERAGHRSRNQGGQGPRAARWI